MLFSVMFTKIILTAFEQKPLEVLENESVINIDGSESNRFVLTNFALLVSVARD